MPVLKNLDTGLAEDLPQEAANSALASGTHEVPLVSPTGEQGSANIQDAPELVAQGYTQPKTEQLKDMLSTAEHTGLGHQVAAGIEGLGRGVAGPLSDELALQTGSTSEDLRKHQEIYPTISAIGEGVGLIGGALRGTGIGGLLNKAGQVANVGKDAAFIAKATSVLGRGAIEGALYQANNETSKMIQEDPGQTVDSAITHIGLSALLGGAISGATSGATSGTAALWDATQASKVGQLLSDMKGMAKQHLNIPTEAKAPTNPSSIYKSDVFGQGVTQPPIDYSTTTGGKIVSAVIRNDLVDKVSGALAAAGGSIVGHPYLAYLFGKNSVKGLLQKAIPAIMKPLLQTENSAPGFKAAITYALNAVKGENLINKAADSVFGEATQESDTTSTKERDKLKEHLDTLQNNPEHLFNIGKDLGHYMPDHAQSLAESASRAVQYLQSLKPHTAGQAPLDEERKLSPIEEAVYNRALDVAQNPLIITRAIKDGSLTANDLGHLKTLYPSLYSSLNSKIVSNLINKKTDKSAIPYKTKLSLAAFMGQPLDSSMQPQAIMASQGQGQQQAQMQQPKNGTAVKNVNKLDKLPSSYQTMSQSREAFRSNRH